VLIARAYTVLDSMVVEITCLHHTDPAASHLVIREERRGFGSGHADVLTALRDVADLAAAIGEAERQRLGLGTLCATE